MGKTINKNVMIDEETGEVLKQDSWVGFDGFSDKGYYYRRKAGFVKLFPDSLPSYFTKNSLSLLMMLGELMDSQNMLVMKVSRKNKFNCIEYFGYTKDEIYDKLSKRMSKDMFLKEWRLLRKDCLKLLQFGRQRIWVVNPAMVLRNNYLPFWLYEEFSDYIDPNLSKVALIKMQNIINHEKNK